MSKDRQREAVCIEVVRLLRERREKKGLSMNEVAQRSGLSQSMMSLIERNKRNPSLETLLRIGEALETDVGLLISNALRTVHGK